MCLHWIKANEVVRVVSRIPLLTPVLRVKVHRKKICDIVNWSDVVMANIVST